MKENDVIEWLGEFAPLSLAEEWDNVGLLVEGEPTSREVEHCLLTIDLTETVLKEALSRGPSLIVAYHPPIFGGLKRLRMRSPSERVIVRALREGLNVYSPHTALDATAGGVADWLLAGAGPIASSEPITPNVDNPKVGAGRRGTLSEPRSLQAIIQDLKSHLSLDHLRLATTRDPDKASIRDVVVCPGAGGSMFGSVRNADLFITGEMRHHDVLSKLRTGASVILTDHTNCERGFLPKLAEKMKAALGDELTITCAAEDRDPLAVV